MTNAHENGDAAAVQTAIQIGFDVLNILIDQFRLEMGRRFDALWADALSELDGLAGELFHGISPETANITVNLYVVKSRYDEREGDKDATMVLDAFTELVSRVLDTVRKTLGEGLVSKALREAVKILSMVDKYQQELRLPDYFKKKIQGLG
ncbi:MAG: hypothetical protein ABII06_04970 [Pseudomonadota bacterium]